MQIEGKKNLSLLKRILLGHIVYCSIKATRDSDREMEEVWDPEIKETKAMLDAVEFNLAQFKEHPLTAYSKPEEHG